MFENVSLLQIGLITSFRNSERIINSARQVIDCFYVELRSLCYLPGACCKHMFLLTVVVTEC